MPEATSCAIPRAVCRMLGDAMERDACSSVAARLTKCSKVENYGEQNKAHIRPDDVASIQLCNRDG